MKPPFIRSRLSVRFGDWALAGLLAIQSACAPGVSIDVGSGAAGTGGVGASGTGGASGTVGSGGGGTVGSGGGVGTGGTLGSGGGVGTGGTPGNGGAVGNGGSAGGSGAVGGGGITGAGGATGAGGSSATGGATGSGGVGGRAGNGGAVGAGGSGGGGSAGGGSPGTPPSCAPGGPGMTDCGPLDESCCNSLSVTGGTYNRTYRNSGTGPTGQADPATVSSFSLDKYLVTVGRYRQFVTAYNGGWRPSAGSGKHTYLNGGGLAMTAGGVETGWDTSWNGTTDLHPTTSTLTGGSYCDGTHATYTASATGGHENLPINCVNWYDAYAFCIWDGGFLPSEAEWEYAAAGGSAQREYPWGTTAPGTMNQYAIYGSYYTGNSTGLAPVGTATMGAGLWGQLDLAGEIWEWNLDWKQTYVNPCTDCVNLTTATNRIVRGDNYGGSVNNLVPTVRGGDTAPEGRDSNFGVRCARAP